MAERVQPGMLRELDAASCPRPNQLLLAVGGNLPIRSRASRATGVMGPHLLLRPRLKFDTKHRQVALGPRLVQAFRSQVLYLKLVRVTFTQVSALPCLGTLARPGITFLLIG